MKYSDRVLTKRFRSNISSKDAYLSLCKWLAENVISKKAEIGEYTFEVKKVTTSENDQYTFELTLYATLDEDVVNEKHCAICKEVHNLFFVNEQQNCNSCSVSSYRKRLQEKLKIKKQYMKEIITGKVDY